LKRRNPGCVKKWHLGSNGYRREKDQNREGTEFRRSMWDQFGSKLGGSLGRQKDQDKEQPVEYDKRKKQQSF